MNARDKVIPEGAAPDLTGLARDMQLLLAGRNLHDAYEALLPALANWCILASETIEDAEAIVVSVAVDLAQHVEAGYDYAKRQHAEMRIEPITKAN